MCRTLHTILRSAWIRASATADSAQGSPRYVMGRSARTSLFFIVCAGVMLLAASLRPAYTQLWWGGIALLLFAYCCAPMNRLPVNALSIGLGLFCAWLFASAAFLTPHYA